MRRGIGIVGGREVFPGNRGKRVRRTKFKRCIQCGCRNDANKTAWAQLRDGSGLKKISDPEPGTETQGFIDTYDRPAEYKVTTGCRFCGSLNWQSQKPSPLPDDRNLPASGSSRLRKRWRHKLTDYENL